MTNFTVISRLGETLPSPARIEGPSGRPVLRLGAVQCAWHPDPEEHREALAEGIRLAAAEGATVVCLQELTLSPLLRDHADGRWTGGRRARSAARRPDPRVRRATGGRGTACSCTPRSTSADARRRPGLQHRDRRRPGRRARSRARASSTSRSPPATTRTATSAPGDTGFPVVESALARFGFPTCWDQWFPELARVYSLAGAEVLVYPTAIGSEPDHPDFDTAAAVGARDRRQRDRQRHVHGRGQPHRHRGPAHVLRLVVHLRSLRAGARRRRRATSPPCSWPTSTSTSVATGSRSGCSPPAVRTVRAALGIACGRDHAPHM